MISPMKFWIVSRMGAKASWLLDTQSSVPWLCGGCGGTPLEEVQGTATKNKSFIQNRDIGLCLETPA